MSPGVANAFYDSSDNSMTCMYGMMQPPLFSPDSDCIACRYGALGIVLGHELCHGFDNKGATYDRYGIHRQWMTKASMAEFKRRAQCVNDQYRNYGLRIGFATLYADAEKEEPENIADFAGIDTSFTAYKNWVSHHAPEDSMFMDLTGDQLFFVSYAQVWCTHQTVEEMAAQIHSDVHAPPPDRIMVTLRNSEHFANAWNCPAGSHMNPKKKCNVWRKD